ncbi:MAG: hypothetical protein ACWIPJ_10695 [Polaribacter sp.]
MKRTTVLSKEYDLTIQLQHVPFIINAPKFVKPRVLAKNGKLIDLFPTLMGLAKVNHINYTLGSNLLDSTITKTASFVYLESRGEPTIGLLQDSLYYSKATRKDISSLYNLNTKEMVDIQKEKSSSCEKNG